MTAASMESRIKALERQVANDDTGRPLWFVADTDEEARAVLAAYGPGRPMHRYSSLAHPGMWDPPDAGAAPHI